jgi:hypothetical protein
MSKHIIDRRSNPKGKNLSNRQRFIERSKKFIKENLDETIRGKSVKDLKSGGRVRVPAKSIKEPQFQYDPKSGEKDYILPGNKEYSPGDKIRKPASGQGGGGGSEGSDDAYGEDDFIFSINKDEFLDILFEDLELPNLLEKQKKSIEEFSVERSGYVNEGSPNNLNLEQSMIRGIGRRLALKKPKGKKLKELIEERDKILEFFSTLPPGKDARTSEYARLQEIEEEIKRIRARYNAISFIDPIDLKFNNFSKVPKPKNAAVMFCVLDVSVSMQEREKDLAKRFFILLHMFLNMKYDLVDVVFIRHHTVAKECTEEEFFNSKESGGTVVSSALELTSEIIKKRYDLTHWNIYISQASDGDNFTSDNQLVEDVMKNQLLPVAQYFTFLCIVPHAGQVHTDVRYSPGVGMEKKYYELSQEFPNMQLGRVYESKDIYPVFRNFFLPKDNNNE